MIKNLSGPTPWSYPAQEGTDDRKTTGDAAGLEASTAAIKAGASGIASRFRGYQKANEDQVSLCVADGEAQVTTLIVCEAMDVAVAAAK